MTKTLLFGQWEAMCPLPRHLKHFVEVVELDEFELDVYLQGSGWGGSAVYGILGIFSFQLLLHLESLME